MDPGDVSGRDVPGKNPLGPNQLLEIVSGKVGLHKVTVTEGSSMECQVQMVGPQGQKARTVPEQRLSYTGSGLGADASFAQ